MSEARLPPGVSGLAWTGPQDGFGCVCECMCVCVCLPACCFSEGPTPFAQASSVGPLDMLRCGLVVCGVCKLASYCYLPSQAPCRVLADGPLPHAHSSTQCGRSVAGVCGGSGSATGDVCGNRPPGQVCCVVEGACRAYAWSSVQEPPLLLLQASCNAVDSCYRCTTCCCCPPPIDSTSLLCPFSFCSDTA